jgi:predicted nucleic-acid-binding protein
VGEAEGEAVRALDTNIVLRALLQDEPKQAKAAVKLLSSGEVFVLPITVLLEVAWVLRGDGFADEEIARVLRDLLATGTVRADDPHAVAEALRLAEEGLDIAEALHLSASAADALLTFDKRFAKAARRTRSHKTVVLAE